MYSYIVFMLFTVGIMTSASIGVLNVNNSTQTALRSAEDARILSLWEMSIGTALEQAGPNGELAPPVGENDTSNNIHLPPKWLAAPRSNAYGKPIVYCPISRNSSLIDGSGTEAISSKSGSYNANIIPWKNNHEYVIASNIQLDASIPRENSLAFVMSPLGETIPSCQDVVFDAQKGRFFVKGKIASVRVITPAHKINNGQAEPEENEDGVDIAAYISDWSKTNGQDLTIKLSGKDTFSANTDAIKLDSSKSIVLKSSDGTIKNVTSSSSTLKLRNVNLVLDGVDLSSLSEITLTDSTLIANNSVLPKLNLVNTNASFSTQVDIHGSIDAYASKISQVSSEVSVSDGSRNTNLYGSTWTTSSGSSLTIKSGNIPLNIMAGSQVSFVSSELSISGSGTAEAMINNDSTSSLSVYNTSVNLIGASTYGIYSQGTTLLNNSNLSPKAANQVGVYVINGGKFHSESSRIGSSSNRSGYGVVVDSSSYTSSSNSSVYSSYQCISGDGYNIAKTVGDKAIMNLEWDCK